MHSKTIYILQYHNPLHTLQNQIFCKKFHIPKIYETILPGKTHHQGCMLLQYMTRPLTRFFISYIFHVQAKKIDVFSRVLFPFCFAIFNAWYWSYYLSKASSQKKGTKTFSVPGFLTLLSPTWALLGPT